MDATEITLKALLNDVEPRHVTPYLVQLEAISPADEIDILFNSNTGENDPREKLINVLKKRGVKSLNLFTQHLYENYPWVKSKVKEWLDKELKHKLDLGCVPKMRPCEIPREREVEKIQTALINAAESEKPQYVVIYGMVGSGKSVIAAQALREFKYNELYFPNGMFWLPIGSSLENNALLLKLQLLCEYFDENYRPETSSSASRFLKKQARKYEKFLLILDDVWENNIIDAFPANWTILITTRDKTKLNFRRTTKIIELPNGFSLEETKNHISLWVYVSPDDLNPVVEKLHNKYRGLPIVMSMLGTGMSEYGNDEDRWNNMLKLLEEERMERSRRLSGQTNLTKEIQMTVDSLDPILRECFVDFMLFAEDYYIPCEVFEVLWSKSHFDVEDLMDELAMKSLIQKMIDEDSKHTRYGIHDLYLKFLKEQYSTDKVKRHKNLVKKYLELCRNSDDTYDYGRLPKDNYIHIFLAYHLVRAEMFEYFPIIFFDLKFCINKIKVSGPHDLNHDLESYREHYSNDLDTFHDFRNFISRNGHILCNQNVDFVQLALNEPNTSSVHIKALELIRQRSSMISASPKIYLEYCNRSCNYNGMLLSVRPHSNSVSWVVFSPCNQFVASCGDDNMLKIWDSSSGKQLQQFIGHSDTVTCCAFSHDGCYIVSSSLDTTVRMWSTDNIKTIIDNCSSPRTPRPRSGSFIFGATEDYQENCVLEFRQHSGSVTTCAFSHDDEMIASGSDNGEVLVWYPRSGDIKYHLRYHDSVAQINHCCFSSNSRYIASCSNDSNAIVWDSYTGNILQRFFHEDKSVESCRFSADGRTLISASGHYVWKWNIETGERLYQYNNLRTIYYVKCCAFSVDEKKIIGGTSERAVVVWTERNGSIDASYKFHSGEVLCVNIASDGSKLVSASDDGTVMIINMKTDKATSLVSLIPEFFVRFKDNIPYVATIDECNKIRIVQNFCAEKTYEYSEPDKLDITCCSLSPDCSKLLYGTKSGEAYILTLRNGQRNSFHIHPKEITCCQFLDEGKRFITASVDGLIVVWEGIEPGESGNLKPLHSHFDQITKCVYFQTKERSYLLSCSRDGFLIAWDLQNYQSLLQMKHKDTVTSCDVSQNRKYYASTCVDKYARIFDATSGRAIHEISFSTCVRSCQFSPNGFYLAAGDDHGVIKIINVPEESKKQSQEFTGHGGFVNDMVWSPDSTRLVSVADEICWWHIKSRKMLQKFLVKGKRIKHIYTSKDFKVFITIDANGILYILRQIDA